jgi:hypothetical protein
MLTQPWDAANLTVRTFVVNGFTNNAGFNNNLDINQQPSIGLMVEYRPCNFLSIGATQWCGPELADNNHDKLYFTLLQATWLIGPKLSLSGEFLYGTTDSPTGRHDWTGYTFIASHRINECWRLFAQWSDLNDSDGVFGEAEHQQEISAGFAYYLHRHVEARFEYRHGIGHPFYALNDGNEDTDSVAAHLTFGY